ncbi:hypothetical protein SFRURICE_016200 [Spodoptera frugiperda]|nr:hypothetical protein SFRURICE_016200 [Spodoptera frugiperda]
MNLVRVAFGISKGSYYITCITLDLQDQPTSTVSEPTCSSRRHPFTSMTCGPAIGPIDHYVGNGATQPTAPPTVEHLGMHDVSAHAAASSSERISACAHVSTFWIASAAWVLEEGEQLMDPSLADDVTAAAIKCPEIRGVNDDATPDRGRLVPGSLTGDGDVTTTTAERLPRELLVADIVVN